MNEALNIQSSMKPSSGCNAFTLCDGMVVLRDGVDRLFLLNSTGRSFWELFGNGWSIDRIAEHWQQRYGLAREHAYAELSALVKALAQQGLLGPVSQRPQILAAVCPPKRFCCSDDAPPARTCRIISGTFSVQCSSTALEQDIRWLYSHLESKADVTENCFEIIECGSGYALNRDNREVATANCRQKLWAIVLFHLGEVGRQDQSQLLVLHAGAVAVGKSSLLFTAPSGGGKSTLVTYLAHHGYDYLSDDMTPINAATLEAEPAPTCMSIKSGSWETVGRFRPDLWSRVPVVNGERLVRFLTPPPTDPAVWLQRYSIKAIICPRFRPGADAQLEQLDPFELLQEIVESQAYFRKPLLAQRIAQLVEWVASLPGYRLTYGSLEQAAWQISQLA